MTNPYIVEITEKSNEIVVTGPTVIRSSNATEALLVANNLSEIDTPTKKTSARTNLQLETIDLGTFN